MQYQARAILNGNKVAVLMAEPNVQGKVIATVINLKTGDISQCYMSELAMVEWIV